jgi:hypothetical protein
MYMAQGGHWANNPDRADPGAYNCPSSGTVKPDRIGTKRIDNAGHGPSVGAALGVEPADRGDIGSAN